MRMTTRLLSLLTILFVFFKFGESAKAMLSISGDKNFLFYTANLAEGELVGFVYDDTNGEVAMTTCASSVKAASFTLNTDCTVTSTAAIDTTTAVIASEVADFPATGVPSNIMVARAATVPVLARDLTTLAKGAATLVTVQGFPAESNIGSSAVAVKSASSFLCNGLAASHSALFFDVDTTQGTDGFGIIKNTANAQTGYPPVIKCVAQVNSADGQAGANVGAAAASYVVVVSDHADIRARLHLLAVPSVVILHPSTSQATNKSTTVGYVNGKDSCPSSSNLTFIPTTTDTPPQCKGKVTTTTALGNYPFMTFSYNGTNYYLNVTGVNTTTTCSATTNSTATTDSTADAFAFNFKYSEISIGVFLIYLLKMLNSY